MSASSPSSTNVLWNMAGLASDSVDVAVMTSIRRMPAIEPMMRNGSAFSVCDLSEIATV